MRKLIANIDYFIRYIRLPPHIGGMTALNDDGTYDIYINDSLPVEKQWSAFLHELVHCEAGHFDERSYLPMEIKEFEANTLTPIVIGL